MSVKIMGLVWDLDIPRDEKFILLAYADHASHDGSNIYPAIATITKKTGYSERSVQLITRSLEEKGLLIDDGSGPKGTNKWRIPLDWGAKTAPAEIAGVQNDARGGAKSTVQGVQPIAPEPLLTVKEPSSSEEKTSFDEDLADIGWTIAKGQKVSKKQLYKQSTMKVFEDMLESQFRRFPLNWIAFDEKAKENFRRFVMALPEGQSLEKFVDWWMLDERRVSSPPYTLAIVMQRWPQAFTNVNTKQDPYNQPVLEGEELEARRREVAAMFAGRGS